jgi:uncharacterized protein
VSVFVDTSALLAILDADNPNHRIMVLAWKNLIETEETLITSSYVVLELFALAQRRFGIDAIRVLDSDIMPSLNVVWIEAELHRRAVAAVLAAASKKLSLVDCASFEIMRERGIRTAFALDRDFATHGFSPLP